MFIIFQGDEPNTNQIDVVNQKILIWYELLCVYGDIVVWQY